MEDEEWKTNNDRTMISINLKGALDMNSKSVSVQSSSRDLAKDLDNYERKFRALRVVDEDVVGEKPTQHHLQDILSAIDGLWLSFTVREKGERHILVGHEYYSDKVLQQKEKKLANWVFSSSYLEYGFDEPMNALLFSVAIVILK